MHVIGRKDKFDFPELDLKNIPVKTDTGAFTSSIHCSYIREVESNGKKHIEFKLLDSSYSQFTGTILKTRHYKKKTVKSSFGTTENRFVIKTTVVMFGHEYLIYLSLSERGNMTFPVLLGRKFLNRKVIVNPVLKNISFNLKQHKNHK